jgi:putative mycofactocin binding protein MftB
MNWHRTYRLAPGFGFRKEAFGGILFHYEGRAPDPRLTFVESPFLIDLLEWVEAAPLEQLMTEARGRFALDPAREAAMRAFFTTLVERQALVPATD